MNNKKFKAPKTVEEFAELLADTRDNQRQTYVMDGDVNTDKQVHMNRRSRRLLEQNRLHCPECRKLIVSQVDKNAVAGEGRCLDCSIKRESALKAMGIWEPIIKWKVLKNKISILSEELAKSKELLDGSKKGDIKFITNETGIIERWNIDPNQLQKEIGEYIETINIKLGELQYHYDDIEKWLDESNPDWKKLLQALEDGENKNEQD